MNPELEERIYRSVLKGVMWGEEREKAFRTMEVNGVTDAAAESMYERACNERIAVLRSEGIRRTVKGALMLAGGIGVFCFFGLVWEQLPARFW